MKRDVWLTLVMMINRWVSYLWHYLTCLYRLRRPWAQDLLAMRYTFYTPPLKFLVLFSYTILARGRFTYPLQKQCFITNACHIYKWKLHLLLAPYYKFIKRNGHSINTKSNPEDNFLWNPRRHRHEGIGGDLLYQVRFFRGTLWLERNSGNISTLFKSQQPCVESTRFWWILV